jgi:hypothetical protein
MHTVASLFHTRDTALRTLGGLRAVGIDPQRVSEVPIHPARASQRTRPPRPVSPPASWWAPGCWRSLLSDRRWSRGRWWQSWAWRRRPRALELKPKVAQAAWRGAGRLGPGGNRGSRIRRARSAGGYPAHGGRAGGCDGWTHRRHADAERRRPRELRRFRKHARERLTHACIRVVFVTATVSRTNADWPSLQVISVTPLIATAICRFLGNGSIGGLCEIRWGGHVTAPPVYLREEKHGIPLPRP